MVWYGMVWYSDRVSAAEAEEAGADLGLGEEKIIQAMFIRTLMKEHL